MLHIFIKIIVHFANKMRDCHGGEPPRNDYVGESVPALPLKFAQN